MFCDWHPLYNCTIGSDAANPAQDFRRHGYIDNFFSPPRSKLRREPKKTRDKRRRNLDALNFVHAKNCRLLTCCAVQLGRLEQRALHINGSPETLVYIYQTARRLFPEDSRPSMYGTPLLPLLPRESRCPAKFGSGRRMSWASPRQ